MYRLLENKERIKRGDEYFSVRTMTWESVTEKQIGTEFLVEDVVIMRRKIGNYIGNRILWVENERGKPRGGWPNEK